MWIDVVGHDQVVGVLKTHTTPNTSYIFHGPSGVGKGYVSHLFFRWLACEGTQKRDCDCKPCDQARRGVHADYNRYQPSGQSYGVSQIQEILDMASECPDSAPHKFYVLDSGEKLTPNAANSLLKNLEEGSPRSVFVFLVEDESGLLDTIRSRSVSMKFGTIPISDIEAHLSKYTDDGDMVRLCANLSGGSIGIGLDFLRGGSLSVRDTALEFIMSLNRLPVHQVFDLVDSEENSDSLFYLLRHLFVDMALVGAGLQDRIANFDKVDQLTKARQILGGDAVSVGNEKLNYLQARHHMIKATHSAHLKNALLQIKASIRA